MDENGASPGDSADLVLDASIALAWIFEDEANQEADAIRERLKAARAFVPAIWPLEVTNSLVIGERRGRVDADKVGRFFAVLQALPIEVEPIGMTVIFGAVWGLARSQGLTAYDATYLELAMRRGLPLATLDRRLRVAATAAGVTLYEPG